MPRTRPFPYMASLLLMFLAFGAQAFAQSNPCDRIRSDYGAKIKALKHWQKLQMKACRASSGNRCSGLKKQQKDAMRQLKLERDTQIQGCEDVPLVLGIPLSNTNDCYNARQDYVNDYYNLNPGDDDNYTQPPPGKGRPGKGVNARNGDGDYHGPRLPRDDSGMDSDPGHSSPRDSSSSPSRYDAGSQDSGGGSSVSYSSGSSSGGSSSSGSSNSSSGGSSSSGSGGYSGGGYSGGSSSSSSSSGSSGSSSASSGSSRSRAVPPK